MPTEQMIPVAEGVELHVLDWSPPEPSGLPFVLVHGLSSNARLWDGVARRLADVGHATIAVDQRGHGLSSKPDAGYDFETITNDLAALLNMVGFERPIVAGQSWGANVAVELAARHPGRTAGIVAVDGGFIDLSERFSNWEDCEKMMAPPRLAGMRGSQLEAAVRSANPDWPEEGITGQLAFVEWRADGTVAPWLSFERHMQILRAMWEQHPKELYRRITDPVLWCPADSGEVKWTADKRAGLDAAEALLAHSRVVWFSPAHHDVHAQKPAEVAAAMLAAIDDGFFV